MTDQPNTVWILEWKPRYESGWPVGVYASEEAAEAALDYQMTAPSCPGTIEEYSITQYTVEQ